MSPPLLKLVEPVPVVPVLPEAPVGLLVLLCIRAPPVAVSELIPLIPPPVLSIAAMPVSVLLVAPLGMAPDSFPAPLAAPLSLPLFPPQAARAIIVRDPKSQGVFFTHHLSVCRRSSLHRCSQRNYGCGKATEVILLTRQSSPLVRASSRSRRRSSSRERR